MKSMKKLFAGLFAMMALGVAGAGFAAPVESDATATAVFSCRPYPDVDCNVDSHRYICECHSWEACGWLSDNCSKYDGHLEHDPSGWPFCTGENPNLDVCPFG
jgi:hypothetical protein